jgi:hypothetical protein
MANVSKLIFCAAIAAVSIASPALAAHKGKPIPAYQNGYVTGVGVPVGNVGWGGGWLLGLGLGLGMGLGLALLTPV